jgi:hypothetical protein
MQFPYQKVPATNNPREPWFPLPLIKVRLSCNEKTIQVNALIDSGASSSLFHSSIADVLGIDLKAGIPKEFTGITGKTIEAYFHLIGFQIVGMNSPIEIGVAFTESPGVGALLGQTDFFQHYKVTFERYNQRIEISPARKPK